MAAPHCQEQYDSLELAIDNANTPFAIAIAKKALHLAIILVRKNRGYGNSVFESPVMLPNLPPIEAIKVRMSDKITRIRNLSQKENIDFESLADSYLDLAGYSVLAACVLDCETGDQSNGIEIDLMTPAATEPEKPKQYFGFDCPQCGRLWFDHIPTARACPHCQSKLKDGMIFQIFECKRCRYQCGTAEAIDADSINWRCPCCKTFYPREEHKTEMNPQLPPVKTEVPAGVYYKPEADNFFDMKTRQGMGNDFWNKWRPRCSEFPQQTDLPIAGEPNKLGFSNSAVAAWLEDLPNQPGTLKARKALGDATSWLSESHASATRAGWDSAFEHLVELLVPSREEALDVEKH